jgi:hypothetical protein
MERILLHHDSIYYSEVRKEGTSAEANTYDNEAMLISIEPRLRMCKYKVQGEEEISSTNQEATKG